MSSPRAGPLWPWATLTLVGLNVLVFAAMVVSGISLFNPDAQQVLRGGVDFGPLTLHGEWWRHGTSMFLHFGLLHLAFNMWALFNLGLLAEARLGSRAFLALYLFSGVGGSLTSVFVHPLAVGAGAAWTQSTPVRSSTGSCESSGPRRFAPIERAGSGVPSPTACRDSREGTGL